MMLLFAILLLALFGMVANDWRKTGQHGKQLEISKQNADNHAMNTDALRTATKALDQTLSEAREVNTKLDRLTDAHDSGVRDMRKLLMEDTGGALTYIKLELEKVSKLVKDTAVSAQRRDKRDTALVSTLNAALREIQGVRAALERIAPTPPFAPVAPPVVVLEADVTTAPPDAPAETPTPPGEPTS